MEFLHNVGIGLLLFISSVVAGTLGYFHLFQHPAAPPNQASPTTTQPISAAELAATTAQQIFQWVSLTEFTKIHPSYLRLDYLNENAQIQVAIYRNFLPSYAKDAEHVFFLGPWGYSTTTPKVLMNVDPSTFTVLTPSGYFAKDKNHVFANGTVYNDANAMSFIVLTCRTTLEYGDPCEYAKDRKHVFLLGLDGTISILQGADQASFEAFNQLQSCGLNCFFDAADKNTTYRDGWTTLQFKMLSSEGVSK